MASFSAFFLIISSFFFFYFSIFNIFSATQTFAHAFCSIFSCAFFFYYYSLVFFISFLCYFLFTFFYTKNSWAARTLDRKNNWRLLFSLPNRFNLLPLFFFYFSIFKTSISLLFSIFKIFILLTSFSLP